MHFIKAILFSLAFWSSYGERVKIFNTTGRWEWRSIGRDSDHSNHIGPWFQSAADAPYVVCNREPKREPSVWLRSNFIPTDEANMVEISVTYLLNACPEDKQQYPFCKDRINLYVRQSSAGPTPDPSKAGQFQLIRPPLTVTGKKYTTFKVSVARDEKAEGLFLAFHDSGACVAIKNVQITYNICGELARDGMVRFPIVAAPSSSSSQKVIREGQCNDENSVNKTQLIGQCMSAGEWQLGQKVNCFCRPGYAFNKKACEVCPPGTYKADAANTGCRTCPENSQPGCKRDDCVCKHGYYRVPEDLNDKPCKALPSAPLQSDLTTVVNSTAVIVAWRSSPNSEATHYTVECAMCSKVLNRYCRYPCGKDIKFLPKKDSVIYQQKKVIVVGLKASTKYRFRVYSKNEISDVASKNKWKHLDVFMTTAPPKKLTCRGRRDGNYPHPRICSQYIVCSHWVLYVIKCRKPLFYNPQNGVCDWERNVDCSSRGGYE